jgi:hypothetical protein
MTIRTLKISLSPNLGLNSGPELTVQELSLYRPAPFRTPVERA